MISINYQATYGDLIAKSIEELTPDSQRQIHYNYEEWRVAVDVEQLFAEGQTGDSDAACRFSYAWLAIPVNIQLD